jgi:hypothetical protein
MLLLFNVIILAALGFVIMILFVKNPSPIGFATNQNYQIIAPVPLAIYNALFEQNEFLRQLTDKKLIVSVLARSAPNQVESGVVEGRYAQKFTMDVEFLYTNNQFRKNERKQLVFLILRVLEMENPLGVTIYRFEVKDVDPFVANQGQ